MRVLQREESHRAEIEELRQALLSCAGVHRRKDEEEQFRGRIGTNKDGNDDVVEEKVVCVTSGVSFLGLAIVSKLLLRGYSVRVIVTNQGDNHSSVWLPRKLVGNFKEIWELVPI